MALNVSVFIYDPSAAADGASVWTVSLSYPSISSFIFFEIKYILANYHSSDALYSLGPGIGSISSLQLNILYISTSKCMFFDKSYALKAHLIKQN